MQESEIIWLLQRHLLELFIETLTWYQRLWHADNPTILLFEQQMQHQSTIRSFLFDQFKSEDFLVCLIWKRTFPVWPIWGSVFFLLCVPRSGELRTQKLKSHLVRTQSLNVLPLKPGVGQYIAMHATLTAGEFFLAYFYPSSQFTCIFSKTSPNFFLCWPAE